MQFFLISNYSKVKGPRDLQVSELPAKETNKINDINMLLAWPTHACQPLALMARQPANRLLCFRPTPTHLLEIHLDELAISRRRAIRQHCALVPSNHPTTLRLHRRAAMTMGPTHHHLAPTELLVHTMRLDGGLWTFCWGFPGVPLSKSGSRRGRVRGVSVW